ncbi:MAG TPA: glycosyltransferase family 2 protein [Chitinophagaceae bacterium]|jgi:glycosyltransferase domain-containing protein|nr:glycosyltransferase family 2 protein [Chitinophagaceae bacterium]
MTEKNLPLVTIGLPTYDRPEGLRKAMEWILQQTWPALEIIISDNCSTKAEVQQITAEFAARDKRIKVFRQPENIGLENNFNFVYAQSDAPYFIWMSDDDFFEPNYVEECVSFLEKNPGYVLCSGVAKYYTGNNYIFTEPMFKTEQAGIAGRLWKYFGNVEKNGNFYGVFRNKMLSEIPFRIHVGCDWSFMGKLAILGKLGYVDTAAYHRSAEGNSQTRKKMVTKFGLKGLKNIFFETYTAYVVAANMFTDPVVNKKLNYITRRTLAIMIFFQINWRLFTKFVRKVFKK